VSDEYVEGDINVAPETVDSAPTAVAALEYIVKSLVDEPEAVRVESDAQGHKVVLSLHVAPDDMGRVIGRRGRTAQALRTLASAAGSRDGAQTSVDIVD